MRLKTVKNSINASMPKNPYESPTKLSNKKLNTSTTKSQTKEPIRMTIKLEDILNSCGNKPSSPQKTEIMEPEIEEFNEIKPVRSQRSLLLKNLRSKLVKTTQEASSDNEKSNTSRVRLKPKYAKSKALRTTKLSDKNRYFNLLQHTLEKNFGGNVEIKPEKKFDCLPRSIAIVIDNSVQIYSLHICD